ncbi:MAG: hypothetical protein IJB52_15515 [Clostridia bacterium]|nr:hypothetical protein [Clostridia bacterium]
MRVYYLYDDNRRNVCSQAGIDDTSAYIPALLYFLGVTGQPIELDLLGSLQETDILIAVRTQLPALPCTVISFAAEQSWEQVLENKWYGTIQTCESHAPVLPIFAPLYPLADTGEEILAVGSMNGGDTMPAIVRSGKRYEFAFDLPASVWYSGDGFEQSEGINGFQQVRVPDMRPLPMDFDTKTLPYNDILCGILRDILSAAGVPMFHTLPPLEDGSIPELALHFSGDDDATSSEVNRTAALHMESRGLPYHINAMPLDADRFIMTRQEFEDLQTHGCEFGLHTNFYGVPFSAETQNAQAELYIKVFGTEPVTNVNHCLIRDSSTAKRLEWLEALGIIGDNDMLGEVDPHDVNAFNVTGYGFGTSFPRFTCAGADQKNRLIRTVEIANTYYEPRLDPVKYPDETPIRRYLDISAERGAYAQFFMHPHYFNESFGNQAMVHAALDLIQKHCREKGYRIWYTTTNTIAHFWKDRADSVLQKRGNGEYYLNARCPLVIQLPNGFHKVFINGKEFNSTEIMLCGKNVNMVSIRSAGEYFLRFDR